MQPYYDKRGITIYCADNREVDLPQADLILTDPPYSEATHEGARTDIDDVLGMTFSAFTVDDLEVCFQRLAPLASRWLVSFLDWRHTCHLAEVPPIGLRFVRFGVWVKPNGAPQFTGDRPGPGWESIAFLHKADERLRWNGGGKTGVYTHNKPHHDHRISDHPNAKPIPLLAELIKDFSDPGDLVLDPFGGSGAVAAAASLTGRRCVVVEREERHCHALAYWLDAGRPMRGGLPSDAPLFDLLDAA